jgi:single-stranded-DNA-specific exonuclease
MDSSRRIVRRASAAADLSTDLHPVLARLYAARAVQHPDELDLSLERLLPPGALKHMDAAVALLAESVRAGQHVM